ncbi:MAG: class I SAM-dependent methyltransferase [Candidatus Bathyarchaeota archaeon]|nr:class I SAM-dependent methyltransferase [Candidatus Bathyarchaeota archaeon]
MQHIIATLKFFLFSAKATSMQMGFRYTFREEINILFNWAICKIFKPRTFTVQGDGFQYFYHIYNTTWANERAVEVPIIWKTVRKYRGKRVLEVGNVLSHYFFVTHDVLDKCEQSEVVINQDVVDFRPAKNYDLIVSISTLEHVGWDEIPREPMKILHALDNLKKILASGGKMIITLPVGHNPELDRLLRESKIDFSRRICLKRISLDNKWIEVGWNNIANAKIGHPFPRANGLVVGIIEKCIKHMSR